MSDPGSIHQNTSGRPRPRVCVTGANGFIGSHVADAFAQAGIETLCQSRPGSSISNLLEAGIEHRHLRAVLDATDSVETLARSFEGLECVVHIAGRSSDWGARSQFETANVVATKNVFMAARAAGVKRVILAGSISSYGEEHNLAHKDETWPFAPKQAYFLGGIIPSGMNHYRETKAEATRWAMEFGRDNGMSVTILEPVWIFGEREASSGFFEYLDAVKSLPVIPGSEDNFFPVFYVGDLARAFVAAYRDQPPGIERFIVGSQHDRRLQEIYRELRKQAGLRTPWLVPRALSMAIGFALEALWTLFGVRKAPPLTRARVAMMCDSIFFSSAKFHRVFGPFPETPFDAAIGRTVGWYQKQRSIGMSAKTRTVAGFSKQWFNLRVCIDRTFYFGKDLLAGKISLVQYVTILRRLLGFLWRMQHNKFTEIDGKIRLGLYIPGFPSRAFDQATAKFATFGAKSPNTTVLISLTSACAFRCEHCYQHLDKGADSQLEPILQAARELQARGTAFVNIEGGDTFLAYERLRRLCETLDDRSEIWVNSAGMGITTERLRELKALGLTAVMFSMHSHLPEKMNSFMGRPDAWSSMQEGVRMCHEAGVAVAFNSCLTVEQFGDGTFDAIMERAKEFGACLVQLIKPKAAGNWLHSHHSAFPPEVLALISREVARYNQHPAYREYPSISAQIVEESPGVFGCTAGGTDRFYINAKGDVQPCEFLNISFGNLNHEPFGEIFDRMRATFDRAGETWLCEKYSGDVAKIMAAENLDRLPLSPEHSRKIHQDWDRGPETELYRKIEDR